MTKTVFIINTIFLRPLLQSVNFMLLHCIFETSFIGRRLMSIPLKTLLLLIFDPPPSNSLNHLQKNPPIAHVDTPNLIFVSLSQEKND